MRQLRRAALLVVLAWTLPALAADTLVVKDGASFKPGVATAWKEAAGGVELTLAAGSDAKAIAATLAPKLTGATVTGDGTTVTVKGLALAALLDKLATISVAAEGDDPLASLGLGGSTLAAAEEDGSQSIRATSARDVGSLTGEEISSPNDPKQHFAAKVQEVERGATYPEVTLTLLVTKPAKGDKSKLMKKGKPITAKVKLPTESAEQEVYRRNLAAYYLLAGDKIEAHATQAEDGTWTLDWLERSK